MVRDNTTQRVTPRSLEAWEGRNSINTCSNGTNEESIGIYAKMEWLLDRFGAQTTKLWPFEVARALVTAATAKAPRGSGGLPKQKCLESSIEPQHREAANDPIEYYRGGVVSLPTSKCPGVT